jgi:hypothetical protein
MSDWQKALTEIWESIVLLADELSTGLQETVEELTGSAADEVETLINEVKEIQAEQQGQDWFQTMLEEGRDFLRELLEENPDLLEWWGESSLERPTRPEQNEHLFDFSEEDFGVEEWPVHYEPRKAATPDHQPACVGCRNYNGTTFGGNLLVCGFHPYGCQEDSCPDWESE